MFNKIKEFIDNNDNVDVTISLRDFDPVYSDALNRSVAQAENGDVLSMTMEEFIEYSPKKKWGLLPIHSAHKFHPSFPFGSVRADSMHTSCK